MSKAKSHEEAELPMQRMEQASGSPERSPPSVESTLPEGMKRPSAEGEMSMGGVHKGSDSHMGNSGMSAAVNQLNYETERGGHAPGVGGHHDAGAAHHGIMKKA